MVQDFGPAFRRAEEPSMPDVPAMPSSSRSLHGGIFLIALSILLFQIALTRVFALMMWHHFAYMVVSLALLGFGASGSLLTALRVGEAGRRFPGPGAFAAAAGIATVLAFRGVISIRIDSLELWNDPQNFFALAACFAILSVPFLLGGVAIGATLARHSERVGSLYFFDLLGSALGGAMAPALLERVGAATTIFIAGAVAAAAGLVFAWGGLARSRWIHAGVLAGLLLVTVGFADGGPLVGSISWEIPFAPNKGVPNHFPGQKSDLVIHSAVARVDVSAPLLFPMSMGGQFGDVDRADVVLRGVTQDGTAPTTIWKNARDVKSFPGLDDSNAASAYRAFLARGGKNPDVCVVGVGGGPDLMVALFHDARSVVGVEINSAMVRMLTVDLAEFSGRLAEDPRVEIVLLDGRSYVRNTDRRFDVIQLSGVDTFTALSTGAYTLSESYLYTVEAIEEFYSRLKPGGYVHFSRFLLDPPRGPRETIRLANIARVALQRRGIAEPWRHIVVLAAHGWASTLIKESPFTETEVIALREFAAAERFRGLVFDPFRPGGEGSPQAGLSRLHGSVAAGRALERVAVILGRPPAEVATGETIPLFAEAFLAADAGDGAPLDRVVGSVLGALPAEHRETIEGLMREAARGAHEEWDASRRHFRTSQRQFDILLRANEEERSKFIEDFPYDLRPTTDDRPFFFDYYRLSKIVDAVRTSGDWTKDNEYHAQFPVGHMVLFSSIFQIGLLAVALILLPLIPLRRRGIVTSGKGSIFVYFAALGLGFMFIEIVLMQQFILFLGHPTDALSFVLTGMLAFAGLGALFSAKIPTTKRGALAVLASIVLLVVANAFFLDGILKSFLGSPRGLRILITVLSLAPTAFALGLPFPLGIRVVRSRAPALIPWAWAINGFLSVLSSLLAIVLAMQIGFRAVLLLSALVYAVGFLGLSRVLRDRA